MASECCHSWELRKPIGQLSTHPWTSFSRTEVKTCRDYGMLECDHCSAPVIGVIGTLLLTFPGTEEVSLPGQGAGLKVRAILIFFSRLLLQLSMLVRVHFTALLISRALCKSLSSKYTLPSCC